jgi:hypothetical protein
MLACGSNSSPSARANRSEVSQTRSGKYVPAVEPSTKLSSEP